MQIIPVILSSVSSIGLWPLSRKQYSKQYLPLTGDSIQCSQSCWTDGLACEMAKLWERGKF